MAVAHVARELALVATSVLVLVHPPPVERPRLKTPTIAMAIRTCSPQSRAMRYNGLAMHVSSRSQYKGVNVPVNMPCPCIKSFCHSPSYRFPLHEEHHVNVSEYVYQHSCLPTFTPRGITQELLKSPSSHKFTTPQRKSCQADIYGLCHSHCLNIAPKLIWRLHATILSIPGCPTTPQRNTASAPPWKHPDAISVLQACLPLAIVRSPVGGGELALSVLHIILPTTRAVAVSHGF